MFLGLAVFLVLGITAVILVIRAVRALFRHFSGREKNESQPKAEKPRKEPSKDKAEVKDLSQEQSPQEEQPEELRNRYAACERDGITEAFWTPDGDLALDGKTVADLCVGGSAITYLEFNNRHLAGTDFYGFNIILEENTRMVLTYNGQAVGSITRVETAATAIVNGQQVEGTATAYRVNTFPPTLAPGMTVSDLEAMLGAVDRIKACGSDARAVADVMLSEFTDLGNITKLKVSIDRKIQSKESPKRESMQQGKKSGIRLPV